MKIPVIDPNPPFLRAARNFIGAPPSEAVRAAVSRREQAAVPDG